MRRDVEIIIDGVSVDTFNDTAITLNFESSLLSDVGQLNCNGTQTVSLPRTTKNDRVFDFALRPSYDGVKKHAVLPCVCRVDGITIFDNGLCHLLDSNGDQYSVAMTWGLLHDSADFINGKKRLTELRDYEQDYISWNQNSGVTVLEGGKSRIEDSPSGVTASIFYKNYNYGVNTSVIGKDIINISPCVSLLEIWERIRQENEISITIDDRYRVDMENRFIVLVKNKNKGLQPQTASLSINGTPAFITPNVYDNTNPDKRSLIFGFSGLNASKYYDRYIFKPVGDGTTSVTIKDINVQYANDDFIYAVQQKPIDYTLEISNNGIRENIYPTVTDGVVTYSVNKTFNIVTGLEISIKITRWGEATNEEWYNLNIEEFLIWGRNVVIDYQINDNKYPLNQFRLIPNLPDIDQIDFVKFICNYYGLFPMQRSGMIELVPLNILKNNIDNGYVYSWNNKLVEKYLYTPQKVSFTLDYAQNNSIGYAEDNSDETRSIAYVTTEDQTLDREMKFIEFPFAASRGNRIPQYSETDKAGEVRDNGCEYRLMGVDDDGLVFSDDMTADYISKTNYALFSDIIRKPMTIEEEMLLSLIDLQQLDYTKPVYLDKYGRHFAIISVRWSSDKAASQVKLLKLN